MPHVTFIYPCIGRFPDTKYVRSWQMQPLAIAVLAALTPSNWQKTFYDDRLEPIDYEQKTDLIAISTETYTARRAYQIAERFRRCGAPVVMGGYHASACPEEALKHGDAVCIGEAEGVWLQILQDAEKKSLSGIYSSRQSKNLHGVKYDRNIFRGKNYFKIPLVETGRGCCFDCTFCSIASFYKSAYRRRPIVEIVNEIKQLKEKVIFFVDDNIVGDFENAKDLFKALISLDIRWISQASINVTKDKALLDLMVESGCAGLLIGFESLNSESLSCVRKRVNFPADYTEALHALRERGILVYGTFMFGLPCDSPQLIWDTVHFAQKHKMFLAAFAHFVPFPGTPLYAAYEAENRLLYDRWWMSEGFRFGQAVFQPDCMEPEKLEQCCQQARRRFYGFPSILRRGFDFSANCADFRTAVTFLSLNLLLRKEINQKWGLPLGVQSR